MNRVRVVLTASLWCLAAGAAAAQSAAPAAGSNATIPEKAPATTGSTSLPSTNLDDKSGTLSQKLNDTGGVIQPKGDVDPSMHVGAPQTGTTPVIKPGTMGNGTAK